MNMEPSVTTVRAEQYALANTYHKPKILIVIPHYNYAEFIGEALLSVQQQSYGHFSCILVDDGSHPEEAERAHQNVVSLADPRFTFLRMPDNKGQVHAISAAIVQTDAPFTAVLDPDDRYAPNFLERMLKLHLHPKIYCPSVSCDQFLMPIGKGITTGTQFKNGLQRMGTDQEAEEDTTFSRYGFHVFLPPPENRWLWATTSSFLFRTDALNLLRPNKPLPYKGQGDAWYANGAHMLGGTILLREPLVYRGLHGHNDFISNRIFSMWQVHEREGAVAMSDEVKIDVVQAFIQNGGLKLFSLDSFSEVITAHFRGEHMQKLLAAVPQLQTLISKTAAI